VDKYLVINRDLRKVNSKTFYDLKDMTSPNQLWNGRWLRLRNAASTAQFGDKRLYHYKGKHIDTQTHMGVDLASLANSKVEAANNGRVIFAGPNGIYGETVALDHGQGLVTIYAHLSQINVTAGQEVVRGDTVGLTGQTGLAAGDHLHFAVMVNGQYVNPIEWWDYHWVEDNILKKLALLEK
jgi:murein DD-endopeptidase MepM/ murein hydrolase activator NlpD